MLWPPLVVRIRVARRPGRSGPTDVRTTRHPSGVGPNHRRRGGKMLGLWLPVVLLWPAIGALAAVAFAVALPLSVALRASGHGKAVLWSVPCLLRLFAAARGLELDVADGDREITVRFI